ncbi:Transcription factor yanR [Penicillium rolfsii]|nr:Transcription factor yanR [Penicillium rolfsii]
MKKTLNDAFFYDEKPTPHDLPPSHISAASLAKVLFSLPAKPAADALIQSFFISVYPIHPLVDISTFQIEYEGFWAWARAGDLQPPARLVQDPTFTCLLFAMFYSGASVISPSTWTEDSSALKDLDRQMTIKQLKIACSDSFSACRHSEHPTLNTLVGSILVHEFSKKESLNEDVLFIASAVRLAQSMGLHQENDVPDLIPTMEQRRQIWWHISWLDVQYSLASGLPTCLGNSALDGVQMISAPEDSAIKLLAVGRYEAARLQNKLMSSFQTTASPNACQISQEKVAELLRAAKSLGHVIDTLIAKIPIFEDVADILPGHLREHSLKTHLAFYQDKGKEPTLIGTWAVTSLLLVKLEVVIMLRKLLLGPPDSSSPDVPWNRYVLSHIRLSESKMVVKMVSNNSTNRIFQLSLLYLRTYLRLCEASAFQPYAWFLAEYYGPYRCALLILIYLIHHQGTENEPRGRQYVDDYLEFVTGTDTALLYKKPQTQMAVKVILHLCGQAGPPMFANEDNPVEPHYSSDLRELQDMNLWDSVMIDSGFCLHGADLHLEPA